jgi:hypothetical protein
VMEQPMPDVRRYRPDTPEPVANAIMKALDRDPSNRYDTARQFGTSLLDAISTVRRPWSHGEISDFIRTNFVEEIAKRHAQVASAIHRTEVGRTTMPLISHDEETQIDERDEDLEFPSVDDSTVNQLPVGLRESLSAASSLSTDFGGVTPPPFGADSQTSGASLQPLRPETPLPPPRRSLVWPLLALSMVGIAGGALYLVYKQTQQQQQPQGPIVIEQRPALPEPPQIVDPPPRVDPPAGSGSARTTPQPPPQKRITDDDAYKQAFHSTVITHKDVLNRCLTDNAGVELPTGAIVSINTEGHATDVTLTPVPANKTPLGTCLRAALQGMHYPLPASPKQLTFPFVKKTG